MLFGRYSIYLWISCAEFAPLAKFDPRALSPSMTPPRYMSLHIYINMYNPYRLQCVLYKLILITYVSTH